LLRTLRQCSGDNKHDADAVLEFQKQALNIVSKDIRIQIKEIHQWTDGCAAQYKGKKSELPEFPIWL
jgi:hypothetical protein